MTETFQTAQAAEIIERTYAAPLEELWALWTTRDGFESWWGPQGFRVEVSEMDARPGGALVYEMIADAPEAIAAMKAQGQPLSHATRGWFEAIEPMKRIVLKHSIDFVPGQPVYDSQIDVDFYPVGEAVRMVTTLHPHLDPNWTDMAARGYGSQLTKLDERYGGGGR